MGCCNHNHMTAGEHLKAVSKLPVSDIAKGAVGLVQEALDINIASPSLISERINTCRECEQATRNTDPKFVANKGLTTRSQCKLCTCRIQKKARWKHSSCPLKKWKA